MAEINLTGAGLGNALMDIMSADSIEPGDAPSYEMCKIIYEYHPLGAKLVEAPIKMAMAQGRRISVAKGPEDRVRDQFNDQWKNDDIDTHIFNTVKQSRIYGISSVALKIEGQDPAEPIKFKDLWKSDIAFTVFDPLNTAGSLVLNQNPNAIDFMKTKGVITVQGQTYNRTRVVVQMNEEPIYLGWTTSAYGFVGRSVYQRTLYPLKSFIQSMRTDDMVTRKAGLIVAKLKQAGSIVNAMMASMAGVKRNLLKDAGTGNVISVDIEEDISSINLQNVNEAQAESRKNILNNIAAGAGMPSIMLNEETFAEGFGEGSEDAKHVAFFIDQFRRDLHRLYSFFDTITQYRAWNEEFFKTMQDEFPDEYGKKTYEQAFLEWQTSFQADWPSLLTEPESELAKKDDIKLKAIVSLLEVLLPVADPDNKAVIIQWACDNFNALESLFTSPLMIDAEEMANYEPPQPAVNANAEEGMTPPKEPKPPRPRADSAGVAAQKMKLMKQLRAGTGGLWAN